MVWDGRGMNPFIDHNCNQQIKSVSIFKKNYH